MIYTSRYHPNLDKQSPTIKQLNDKHLAELRETLADLYNSLPESNQRVFNLMYTSLDNVAEDQLCWAICQCETSWNKINNAEYHK